MDTTLVTHQCVLMSGDSRCPSDLPFGDAAFGPARSRLVDPFLRPWQQSSEDLISNF